MKIALLRCATCLLWGCLAAPAALAQGLIEFVQPNCPACRQVEPAVERLERSGARVVRYRASEADPVCRTLGIRTTPTFIAVDRQGREVERLVGAVDSAALQALWRRALTAPLQRAAQTGPAPQSGPNNIHSPTVKEEL